MADWAGFDIFSYNPVHRKLFCVDSIFGLVQYQNLVIQAPPHGRELRADSFPRLRSASSGFQLEGLVVGVLLVFCNLFSCSSG
jgi:hypothetical protein